MVSDCNPGTPAPSFSSTSPKQHVLTTPINTGSGTLHRFGDTFPPSSDHYSALAMEMAPYFVGPVPVNAFLSEFLHPSKFLLPKGVPSFTRGMFASVVTQEEEVGMYNPFVCL